MSEQKLREAYDMHAYGMMEELLKNGTNPNTFWNQDKMRPLLSLASFCDDLKAVDLLIQYRADIHLADKAGMTAMHHAAKGNGVRCLERLVDAGADIAAHDTDRRYTPLMHSVAANSVEAFHRLVALGADLDQEPLYSSRSPLKVAAEYNRVELFKSLLSFGADPDKQSRNGQSVMDFVRDICVKIDKFDGEKVVLYQAMIDDHKLNKVISIENECQKLGF